MSALKQAHEYANATLDDIEWLLRFIDTDTNKLRGDKRSYAEFFPAVYLNPDTHRGEMDLLQDDDIMHDFWPFNYSMVISPSDGEPMRGYRIQSIARKEAMGRVTIPAPRMLRLDHIMSEAGTTVAGPNFFGIFPNGVIRDIGRRSFGLLPMVYGLMSASISSYYDWHVVIGKRDSLLQLKLPATPTSAREFLSLRDVPEGLQRRAAIKHWVSKHQRRRGLPEEYDVRAHLRGREEFTWGDYEGWVEPSGHDLAKAIKAPIHHQDQGDVK